MMESSKTILTKLFTEYYLGGAQAKKDGMPVAFVTAFAPVEILRSMGVFCMYPESYAVVCAASNKAPEMIAASGMAAYAQDLCSYSLIDFGTAHAPRLPYGGLPEPDMLIAANNQCGTTLLWFKRLAQQKQIPLFIIDYPAPTGDQAAFRRYAARQHAGLIDFVKQQTGADLDTSMLRQQVQNSRQVCRLWKQVHELNTAVPAVIAAHKLVDMLFPIVVARGTGKACEYYETVLNEAACQPKPENTETVRLLWHGYPMWFLPQKFPRGFDLPFQIVLNDYTLWWSLEYPDHVEDGDALAAACSNTYLNRSIQQRIDDVIQFVDGYSIDGVICHVNRSCRRALADIQPLRQALLRRSVPSVIVESDMANPEFYSHEQVHLQIESFKETLKAS